MRVLWVTFMREHGFQCELCWRNIKLGERFSINKNLIANSPHYAFDHLEAKDCPWLAKGGD